MLEMLSYDFMQRSLLAAMLVGAMCSVIGVFVVLRGLAFVGAGTAHAAFAGVALAYLVGLPPLPLANGGAGGKRPDEAGCLDRDSLHRDDGARHSLHRAHERL